MAGRQRTAGRRPAQKINKSELERLAIEVRTELGLGAVVPLDPYALAELYGISIHRLDALASTGCREESLRYFLEQRPDAWSAALIPDGTGAFILENTAHQRERRRSNIAHEMAHVIREHHFGTPLIGDGNSTGCLNPGDRLQEDEAAELGAALLIPKTAAMQAAWSGQSDEQVAAGFDVSIQLAAWRMNATGARLIATRAKAKRTR